jgi:hypothetical protein
MSRIERLREYQNPQHGPHGASRDKANLNYWSARAKENSTGADTRGSDGEVQLPATGKRQESRPTEMGPIVPRKVNSVMVDAKVDLNHVGGSYLKDIRRDT